MIERLIAILTARGLELNPEEIADSLWLADQMRRLAPPSSPGDAGSDTDDANGARGGVESDEALSEPSGDDADLDAKRSGAGGTNEGTGKKLAGASGPTSGSVEDADEDAGSDAGAADIFGDPEARVTPGGEVPFATPEAPPLPERLQLARALRPLLRRAPSRVRRILDEEATVARIAEADLWVPATRPARERWLDLALVVDAAPSLRIWQSTIRELYRFLAGHGAFRRVDLWSLAEAPEPRLFPGLPGSGAAPAASNLAVLGSPAGRQAILLITDATTAMWRRQPSALRQLLGEWGARRPLTIVQVLPESLWDSTAIGAFPGTQLAAPAPAASNTLLRPLTRPSRRQRQASALPLPVITLEPAVVARWAKLLAGQGGARAYGLLLDDRELPAPPAPADLSPEELVELFLMTASSEAARLAGLLTGAAPLTMRIMRVVQHALIPASGQVALAEVFLSGLLQRADPPDVARDPEDVRYDFRPGVRAQLRSTVPTPAWAAAVEAVGASIGMRLGLGPDFNAWLRVADLSADDERLPFARMLARDLAGLPGRLGDLARAVGRRMAPGEAGGEQTQGGQPDESAPDLTDVVIGERVELIISSLDDEMTISLYPAPDAGGPARHVFFSHQFRLSLADMAAMADNPRGYGRVLARVAFDEPSLMKLWTRIRAQFFEQQATLHLTLVFSPETDESAQGVLWEWLCDPVDGEPLVVSGRALILRLARPPSTLIRHSTGPLSAAVVVPAPNDLERFGLTPFDAEEQRHQSRRVLMSLSDEITIIPSPVTLPATLAALQPGRAVLALEAYARHVDDRLYLWFETPDGKSDPLPSTDLAARLRDLEAPPMLALIRFRVVPNHSKFLARALACIGRELVGAGVKAVLATANPTSETSYERFHQAFLDTVRDGATPDAALGAAIKALGIEQAPLYMLTTSTTGGPIVLTAQPPPVPQPWVVQLRVTPLPEQRHQIELWASSGDLGALLAQARARLDIADLLVLTLSAEAYGRALTAQVFADPALRAAWRSLSVSLQRMPGAQIHLALDPDDPIAHSVRWELLRDPLDDTPLALSEHRLFGRVPARPAPPRAPLPARAELHATVAVVNPTIERSRLLYPFDEQAEFAAVRAGLSGVPATEASLKTLQTLRAHLGQGDAIFYLVGHGQIIGGDWALWVQDEDGQARTVSGRELADVIGVLEHPPALIIMAANKSAGSADGPAASVAARLLDAGVRAVIGFQEHIPQSHIQRLVPALMRELLRDGRIDRAVAVARNALGGDESWWQPVLWLADPAARLWEEAAGERTPVEQGQTTRQEAPPEPAADPGADAPAAVPTLLITIQKSGASSGLYILSAYLFEADTGRSEALRLLTRELLDQRVDSPELFSQLGELFKLVLQRHLGLAQVEIALPEELQLLPVEHWQLPRSLFALDDADEAGPPLGTLYPVVVRYVERLEPSYPRAARVTWQRRWDSLDHQAPAGAQIRTEVAPPNAFRRLPDFVARNNIPAIFMVPAENPQPGDTEWPRSLRRILYGGVCIALVARRPLAQDELAQVRAALDDCPLGKLPQFLFERRREAFARHETRSPWLDLTLVWDDPGRVPPSPDIDMPA